MYRASIVKGLDFVSENNDGIEYWPKESELDWSVGNAIGRERAAQLVSFMQQHQDPLLLGRLAKDIIRSSTYDSVLVGFNYELSKRLINN